MKPPTFTVVGGPNGVGKSTLVTSLQASGNFFGPFINPDDILRALGPEGTELQAGRYALFETKRFIKEGIPFARETTLSGREILKAMGEAKRAGFRLRFLFIGASSVMLTRSRVETRVAQGGHGIPEAIQTRRFAKCFANAAAAARMADEAIFYENKREHIQIARYERAKPVFLAEPLPAWFLPLREALATGG